MASLNRVFIIGNLGADPELRYTQNQTAVATFNVATTDVRMDANGQKQELTEWHRIVVWSKQAENCSKYLSKGRSVFIEGRLQTRSWEDKTTGQKRFTTEIVAQNVTFLGSGPQREAGASQYQQQPRGQNMNNVQMQGYQNQVVPQQNQGGYQNQGGFQQNRAPEMDAFADAPNSGIGGPDTPGLDEVPF